MQAWFPQASGPGVVNAPVTEQLEGTLLVGPVEVGRGVSVTVIDTSEVDTDIETKVVPPRVVVTV